MPLQATSGAASYDAFGGGVVAEPNYIESCFSTYLYTGNDTVQTITNGIDLSTKGGAVFIKSRNLTSPTVVYDTNRGINKALCTNLTNAENVGTLGTNQDLNSFNTNGFAVNLFTNAGGGFGINNSAHNLASWTFRKQPKFFDVVTWTGSNDSGTSIGQGIVPHNLGSAPGCVIIKNVTQGSTNWIVYHRSLSGGYRMLLNTTDAQTNSGSAAYFSKYVNGVGWTQTDPDANNIYVGYNYQTNGNGDTLVAYVFAHNAGGFGLTGTDNVISCGSFTTSGAGLGSVTLGYEPQWVLLKRISSTADWYIADTMRGWNTAEYATTLNPNLTATESSAQQAASINATGFTANGPSSATYIYIAIRRGPMRTPTVGTSVFTPVARAGTSAIASVNTGIVTDAVWETGRSGQTNFAYDRLRGPNTEMSFTSTNAESSYTATGTLTGFDSMTGFTVGADASSYINGSGINYINWAFQRAPGFFDEVCYTGNYAANPQVPHNLGVPPEMLIARTRADTGQWYIKHIGMSDTQEIYFNNGAASAGPTWVRTSTYWQYSSAQYPNDAHVAYLFATCAGVSKVGSYTGTGTTKQVDCGFAAGARFVLIKRTDSTGDWYVWDSARGIVSGNDPYLLLNSTAAETTGTDYIDTYSAGFEISSTAPAAINASGGSFIFLAVA